MALNTLTYPGLDRLAWLLARGLNQFACVCVFVVSEVRSDCAEASADGQLLAVFGRKDMRGKPRILALLKPLFPSIFIC